MAKITGGPRKAGKRGKTRAKFRSKSGKVSVSKVMQEFEIGDRVQVVINSSSHAGLPGKGFHGLTGKIAKKRGESYEVELKKGDKDAIVITTPVHLKKLK